MALGTMNSALSTTIGKLVSPHDQAPISTVLSFKSRLHLETKSKRWLQRCFPMSLDDRYSSKGIYKDPIKYTVHRLRELNFSVVVFCERQVGGFEEGDRRFKIGDDMNADIDKETR